MTASEGAQCSAVAVEGIYGSDRRLIKDGGDGDDERLVVQRRIE